MEFQPAIQVGLGYSWVAGELGDAESELSVQETDAQFVVRTPNAGALPRNRVAG